MNPRVSILIPCKDIDILTIGSINKCKELDYDNFEIIALPDFRSDPIQGVRILPTDEVSPGRKRNIGMANSDGEYLAFIDNDAYPRKDWLKNAIRYFNDPDIAAVGGPGVTPDEDDLLQKAGGYVLSSFMMGGLSNRFRSGRSVDSDDIHSCNFIAQRSVLEKTGGWNEKYWPGEDTLMCLSIKKLGKKMIEAQDVLVYHHRRPLFSKHLKQVSRFGQHRGFFAKKYPETSLRLNYFIPSFLVLFIITGPVISLIEKSFFIIYVYVAGIYLIAAVLVSLMAAVNGKDARLILLVFIGTIITHISYGINFISGSLSQDLKR